MYRDVQMCSYASSFVCPQYCSCINCPKKRTSLTTSLCIKLGHSALWIWPFKCNNCGSPGLADLSLPRKALGAALALHVPALSSSSAICFFWGLPRHELCSLVWQQLQMVLISPRECRLGSLALLERGANDPKAPRPNKGHQDAIEIPRSSEEKKQILAQIHEEPPETH